MATKQGNLIVVDNFHAHAEWDLVTEADTGTSLSIVDFPDRTVQAVPATGSFGTAGAITLEGSNDNTTFSTLHDFQGNALVLTDSTLHLIAENPRYIRPRATAGSGMSISIIVEGNR